jgi:hypothetical protein
LGRTPYYGPPVVPWSLPVSEPGPLSARERPSVPGRPHRAGSGGAVLAGTTGAGVGVNTFFLVAGRGVTFFVTGMPVRDFVMAISHCGSTIYRS